jgi:hypothetical protein
MPVVRGSCLCGGVKYEITGPLMRSGHCHCSNCRKAHGAARSRARVRVEDFKWVQGEELVKYFESSPGFHRGFCSVCGSPIVSSPDRTPELGIALGGLDDDPGVRPERHFFVAGKAPWFEITDDRAAGGRGELSCRVFAAPQPITATVAAGSTLAALDTVLLGGAALDDGARTLAIVSLASWILVLLAGRSMAYP